MAQLMHTHARLLCIVVLILAVVAGVCMPRPLQAQVCQSVAHTADPYQASGLSAGSDAAADAVRARAANAQAPFGLCSEVVDVVAQQPISTSAAGRSGCPHLEAGLTPLSSSVAGADITIPAGTKALLTACSISPATLRLGTITVQSGAELIFDDTDMELHVREIRVDDGGKLRAGSPTCHLFAAIDITFYGSRMDSSIDNADVSLPSKGLRAEGDVDIFGHRFSPTWTRLSHAAEAGDSTILVRDAVNWEVGQQVVVMTSVLYDCPPNLSQAWCKPCQPWQSCAGDEHQNEIRTIISVGGTTQSALQAIELDQPLTYAHYAGVEYQSEVALLSRRIVLTGEDNMLGDGFGGHLMVAHNGRGRIAGVQGENMGQLNVLGRYPFHMHMQGEAPESYFEDNSVTNSQFRCFVVHGTNSSRLSRNVAYNALGNCYYLEDGVEENNLLEYNLAAHIHPIGTPASGGSQTGDTFVASATLLIPADATASGFYVPNAWNELVGNAASGGWSGFAYPKLPLPTGAYEGVDLGLANPQFRPVKRFYGNTAHSTGFYWPPSGGAIYFGALLWYDNTVLTYNSGRHERSTSDTIGNHVWPTLEHSKVWLTRNAISHWGQRVDILHLESHDAIRGPMVFGESSLVDAVINGRSNNALGVAQMNLFEYQGFRRVGFEFYDTWVKIILSRIVFRNLIAGDSVLQYLVHSDQFLPQNLNAVRDITVEASAQSAALVNCVNCPSGGATMSARMSSVIDHTGSLRGNGRPTVWGGASPFWNVDGSCSFDTSLNIWSCDAKAGRGLAYMKLDAGPRDNLYGGNVCAARQPASCPSGPMLACCVGQKAYYTTGSVRLFGRPDTSIATSPWVGVSGHSNTGWLWRSNSTLHSYAGAPSEFHVYQPQIEMGDFVVIAVAYPAQATFTVELIDTWGGGATIPVPMSGLLGDVLSTTEPISFDPADWSCSGNWNEFCEDAGLGAGPGGFKWHFDGQHLYLRMVDINCYITSRVQQCLERGDYERDDMKVRDIGQNFVVHVTVNSCSGCTVNKDQPTLMGNELYYEVADTSPPVFPNAFGAVRAVPAALAAFRAPTCADGSSAPSNSGLARAAVSAVMSMFFVLAAMGYVLC